MRIMLMGFMLLGSQLLLAQTYDCLSNFQFVAQHLETNYPGFADKVTPENIDRYWRFRDAFETKSKNLDNQDDCMDAINEFIAFFRDGHIQLFDPNGPLENHYLYPNQGAFDLSDKLPMVAFEQLSTQTAYLRTGSFNERMFRSIDSIVNHNSQLLDHADHIILDLRGNEGGATFTYRPILPYLGLDSIHHVGFDVLATEDNISAYQRLLESPYMPDNQKPYIQQNIELMQQNLGQLTSLSDDYTEYVTKNEKPQRIVILIDNNCGSTTEHFLLIAQQSEQVILMGAPTIGMYDYGDMRNFSLPDPSLQLWCATNRSRRLNTNQGIDNMGIQPDIPLNSNKDWVAEALLFLEEK
ncbi:MAG: S41 family peptidase, partial [Bacteroidota bacterium]